MKRKSLAVTIVMLFGLSAVVYGLAHAQQPASGDAAQKSIQCPCMEGEMRGGMMGMMPRGPMGGMGRGMMGMQSGMMGSCPMMVPEANVEVKSLDKGAAISITSDDARAVWRIQRMAEMMRLMHELQNEQ